MAQSEINIITHLLDVEQNAFLQIKDAQEKAGKITASAHAQADSEFNSQWEKLSIKIDQEFEEKKEKIQNEHNESLSSFKNQIQNTNQNKKSFEEFVKLKLQEA